MSVTIASSDISQERLARQKARLQELLDQARERYAGGAPGLQVASLISQKTDRLIVELFEEALSRLDPAEIPEITANIALIAIGGSGRGELAPYSDADMLFLHRGRAGTRLVASISQTLRDCWDAGISPAASTRTVGDALKMARDDPQFATALIEARLLWGDARLFESLRTKFYRQVVQRRFTSFYNTCLAAREEERRQHGSTVRQLEPDVKRSPGGLRDIHLIRWLGYARYGTTDFDLLRLEGAISRDDVQTLVAAQEFLTRIRVELHFASGKSQELLTRAEQLRLADLYGFTASAGQRPVERFMQIYFRHSTAIAEIAVRFAALHRPRSVRERVWRYLLTHRSNGIYNVGPDEIDVVARQRSEVCNDLAGLLHLYEMAGMYSINPAPALTELVKQSVPLLGAQLVARPGYRLTEQEARLFLSILGLGNAGQQLRNMYATRVLELVIPQVSHVRCLLQFNQYHAYTVDEHSLRAVEAAERFDADKGPIGTAYREIRPKAILHLALLLHDLGKGYEEDHSQVGRDLAREVAARLYLSDHETELLVFLVHKHLVMAHLAFRRDITEPSVVLNFSREVGSPERLRMLFVMTAADISAVSPEAWTGWKAELLTELYHRAMRALGGEHGHDQEAERLERVRQKVRAHVESSGLLPTKSEQSLPWYEEQLDTFPMHYLDATPADEIVADLQDIHDIDQQAVVVRAKYEPDSHTVEYRVITRDQIGFGCFSKITGALTAKRCKFSANICTTSRGVVVDSFRVHDGDHDGEIPDFRQTEVIGAIRDVLSGKRSVESLLQRHRRFVPRVPLTVTDEPIRVAIDNTSSAGFTIIDVFANDRPGLLYAIASGLLEMDLSVSLAKIATHVDQVLDVFYVTDREGRKIQDEARIRSIQSGLASRLSAFEQQGLTSVSA